MLLSINCSLSLSSNNPSCLVAGKTSLLNPITKTYFLFSTLAKSIVDIIIESLISGIERYLIDFNPIINNSTNLLYVIFSEPNLSKILFKSSNVFLYTCRSILSTFSSSISSYSPSSLSKYILILQ